MVHLFMVLDSPMPALDNMMQLTRENNNNNKDINNNSETECEMETVSCKNDKLLDVLLRLPYRN